MGQAQSLPAAHLRIYQNLLAMKSPQQKSQMIRTLLSSPEHVNSAKLAGLYGHMLHYTNVVDSGGTPPKLPGEDTPSSQASYTTNEKRATETVQRPSGAAYASGANGTNGTNGMALAGGGGYVSNTQITVSNKTNEKAINYFSACLRILGLEEEVALTEEILKSTYKKAVIRAHPDKGGSEKEFEAVTRAFAYLGDILKRIHGGRGKEGKMEAPTALHTNRASEEEKWKHMEPVSLNPKNLDMGAFNKMFEQTRLPDPEEEGYGDWLKGEDVDKSGSSVKFSGKFNREVFNNMFEDAQKSKASARGPQQNGAMVVQEMSLASRMGYATELGRGFKEDYTIAPHEGKMAYTDLKKAYTEYNTISHEVAGVKVDARSLEQMNTERKGKVVPLSDPEMMALREAEAMAARAEEQRKLRYAQQSIAEQDHFDRMKRLVIRN